MSVQTNTTFALRLPFQVKSMKRRNYQQSRCSAFVLGLHFSKFSTCKGYGCQPSNFAEKFANIQSEFGTRHLC